MFDKSYRIAGFDAELAEAIAAEEKRQEKTGTHIN